MGETPGLRWNVDATAMVVYAVRDHAVGEELCISYGPKSNPLLFRDYGFTVCPQSEPCWEYILQGNDAFFSRLAQKHGFDYDAFLPGKILRLNSRELDSTL